MGSSDKTPTPTVLLTGYGPFKSFTRNSSWLTVQEVLKKEINGVRIIAEMLPVEYDFVSKRVPLLWEKYNPTVAIHCGMSNEARCLTIEQVAYNDSYICADNQGKLPADNACCCEGPEFICTTIDVHKVIEDVNKSEVRVKAEASKDAGRYLCEFVYYTSLRISRNTIFVHVPPEDKPYSVQDMAESLIVLIHSVLKQCTDR